MPPTTSEPRTSALPRVLAAYVSLALVVGLLFARVIGYPFIAFDDAELIVRNPEISAPFSAPLDLVFTPRAGYIVPVTIAFEAALHALSHGAPWSFHAAALALHVIYVLQLLAFARMLGAGLGFSWLAALVFAVHPLVVQPVSWAICIKDLLMANLIVLATRFFARATDPYAPGRWSWLALACAVLAMLAKPSATLIGIAWLGCALASARAGWALARRAPLVALICTGLGLVIAFASRFAHNTLLGDALSAWSPSTPFTVLGQQLSHVLWPRNLMIVYAAPVDAPAPRLTWLGVGALLVGALAVVHARRRPSQLLALLLAGCVYLPTSNVLPFGRVISDSYMYVPLSLLAVFLALEASARFTVLPGNALPITVGLGVALAGALAFASSAELEAYRGGRALWDPVVRTYPRLAQAHRLMGDELLLRGEPAQAAVAYEHAYANYYDPRYLMQFGTILGMANRLEDAECTLIEAVAFGSDRGYALYNYAAVLAFNPEYAPKYPSIAKQLLSEFDRARRAGAFGWPPALEPGFMRQLARARTAPAKDLAWRPRTCAVLRTRPH